MIDQPTTHPHVDQLSAFALGKLESNEVDVVESHLASCETCCDALKKMQEDTFIGIVRQSKNLAHEAASQDLADATLAAGQPAARPALADAGADSASQIPNDLTNHARYRIMELVGKGGMGAVYKAEHRLMQRVVALKVINPQFVVSAQAVERFRREVQAAARLDHPNIVRAYDAEQAGDVHFLVMEFVPGTDLGKVLEERGPLPVAEACEYIRQAALGLEHARQNGMVHRDIKPQNLILSSPREICDGMGPMVKILDFGLASLTSDVKLAEKADDQCTTVNTQKSGLTQAGSLMGTPDYMAPEQGRDASSADIRSDIYSLGCTLYALLTGVVPFPGGNANEKVQAHSFRPVRPINELRRGVPAALVTIIGKMLAKNAADRYQTPAEVAQALAKHCGTQSAAGTVTRSRRHRTLSAVLAVALFAGIVTIAGIAFYNAGGVSDHRPAAEIRRFEGHGDVVRSLAVSPDGRLLLSGGGEKTGGDCDVRLWDMQKGTEIRRFKGHTAAVFGLAFSPDGRRALSSSADRTVRLWEVASGKLLASFENAPGYVFAAQFSPDGSKALAGMHAANNTGQLWLLDLQTKEVAKRIDVPGQVFCVAFMPDGRRALSGDYLGMLRLWDLESGEELKRIKGHNNWLVGVALAPDGQHVLTGSKDRTMRLWDIATGAELKVFAGHKKDITEVSFSPDGRRAVTASNDSTVRVWDLATNKELKRLEGQTTDGLKSVVFLPDGRHIATSGADATIRLWRLSEPGADVK